MRDPISQFRGAIAAAGLTVPETIETDGLLHRFASNGNPRDTAGWYVYYGDTVPAGGFGCWRTGVNQTWRADTGKKLTPSEDAAHKERIAAIQQQRKEEEAARRAEVATKAKARWEDALPASDNHPYLVKKGVQPYGIKEHDGNLIIPLRTGPDIHSLQTIRPDGDKRFLTGGRISGCYYSIGRPDQSDTLCIAEGFSTGASVHEATGYPVTVAFNAGNLEPVAKAIRTLFPGKRLVICADDDYRTDGNPGIAKATEAARAVNGIVAIPDFGEDRPDGATDFNDLHQHKGLEAVQEAIRQAIELSAAYGITGSGEGSTAPESFLWPDPQPLETKTDPMPYPVEELPDTIRQAVTEVQHFVKAPVSLVAASAIGALSLAVQGHIDVERATGLKGPSGLFLLTIADSGERKSTCDSFFMTAIRSYEESQRELAKPALQSYESDLAVWEARRNGLKDKIRALEKDGKDSSKQENDFRELGKEKPEQPKFPRLLYADVTPEALAYGLVRNWPSGGVISAEGGTVLGSHGMGKDSIMRNLSLLNQLWDGGQISVDRRTSESFTVSGARLTVALQIQEATLRGFFNNTGALARGTGFMARFLIAWPESTQGTRHFTEAPDDWPALGAFNRKLTTILENPVDIDENGSLSLSTITLSADAKKAWIGFHDAVESMLTSGGDLYDIRDVSSKAADNAARLASLFHVFEHGVGPICADCFRKAATIITWHLNESKRFFGEMALPEEMANMARLDEWLIRYCRENKTSGVSTRRAQQFGPVRKNSELNAALDNLQELDRLSVKRDGKQKMILVNPALLEGMS